MKFLIWFLCIMANAIITMLINGAGIVLGGIPSALLFAATLGLATALCKKWDAHKEYGGLGKDTSDADSQVTVKKENRLEQQISERTYAAPVSNSQWQCSCGRVHPKYESSCVCGKSKYDSVKSQKTEESSAEATEGSAAGSQSVFCHMCGEKLIENSKFCGKCGTEIQRM